MLKGLGDASSWTGSSSGSVISESEAKKVNRVAHGDGLKDHQFDSSLN